MLQNCIRPTAILTVYLNNERLHFLYIVNGSMCYSNCHWKILDKSFVGLFPPIINNINNLKLL